MRGPVTAPADAQRKRGRDRTAAHEDHLASTERLNKSLGVGRRARTNPTAELGGYANSAARVKKLCSLSTAARDVVIPSRGATPSHETSAREDKRLAG